MKREVKAAILASLAVVLFWTLAIYAVFTVVRSIPAEPIAVVPQPPTVEELLKLVNEERARVGVAPLVIDARLNASAQMKADDMVVNNYFGHEDKNGKHGYEFAQQLAGESCYLVGENIYWGRSTNTSSGALQWWMNSKPHRGAILNSNHTLTGIGIAENKIVQHFCTPS